MIFYDGLSTDAFSTPDHPKTEQMLRMRAGARTKDQDYSDCYGVHTIPLLPWLSLPCVIGVSSPLSMFAQGSVCNTGVSIRIAL